jgi:hypothetical protein
LILTSLDPSAAARQPRATQSAHQAFKTASTGANNAATCGEPT